jgi:hypothetical protein
MYPSTNVSHLTSRENRFTDMHVSPYCTSTITGTFFNSTSRETALFNRYVGRQGNVSNVVCQAERCLSVLFRSFISPHMCVLLDTYATVKKIEMAEA